MLRNSILVAELNVSPKKNLLLLRDLKENGWVPAMLDTLEYFGNKSKAELKNPLNLKKMSTYQPRKYEGLIKGDIFL